MIELISSRQMRILYILSDETGYISSSRIANILGTSSKTVMNDIKAINSCKLKECMEITSKRHVGYKLKVTDKERYSQLLLRIKKELKVSLEDKNLRVFEILILLLLSNEVIDFYSLQTRLYISDSTLRSDLRVVRKYLEPFYVQVIVQSDETVHLVGSEFRKRLLITNLVKEISTGEDRLDQLKKKYQISHTLITTIIEKIQYLLIKQNHLGLAGEVISLLAYYIVVSTVRIKHGHPIIHDVNLDNDYHQEANFTKSLVQYINIDFGNVFTELEVQRLLLLVISYSNPRNILEINLPNETIRAARRVIDLVCDFTGEEDLRNDQNFNEQVYTYLYSKYVRAKFRIYYDFLPMNMIKRKRISGVEISIRVCEMLEKEFGMQFNYQEVTLFSLCFGNVFLKSGIYNNKRKIAIASKYGLIEARRISEMIRVLYALYVESIDLYPSFEIPNLPRKKYDFILTDDEAYKESGVYYIKPFTVVNQISDDLKNRIQNRINGTRTLLGMLEGNIHQRLKLENKREIFEFISGFVTDDNEEKNNVAEQLYARNRKFSFEIGNKFAVVVVKHSYIKTAQLKILVLNRPIQWDNREVSVVQVLYTNGRETSDFRYVGGSMLLLTDNMEFVNEFISNSSIDVIKKYIQ